MEGEKTMGSPLPYHNPDGKPAMQQLSGPITENQLKMINNLCNRYKANALTVARDVCKDVRINALQDLTAQEAFEVQNTVNTFQSSPVPANWKI
jgi:hypothetical protein